LLFYGLGFGVWDLRYHYLNWSWKRIGVFQFQSPIWRFDFWMKKLCFRFSADIQVSRWLTIILDQSNSLEGKIWTRKKNGQNPLGKPTKYANHPRNPTPVLQIVIWVHGFRVKSQGFRV
jgi:hypothetical protein